MIPGERRYWMYHSFAFALLCAILAMVITRSVPWAFVVICAWSSLGGLTRFLLDNLNGADARVSQHPGHLPGEGAGPASSSHDGGER